MKKSDVFPSKYLKADDIGDDDMLLTIERVENQDVGMGDKKEMKPVVYFEEQDKGLVLNSTNWDTIEKLTGEGDTDNWPGHKVTLYTTEVEFQGKVSMGIRVRLRNKAATAKPAKASTSAADLNAIKSEVWKALKAKYPTVTSDDELKKILAGHVGEFFEGQTPATIGTAQYRQLIDNDFDSDKFAIAS